MAHASGPFDVSLTRQAPDDEAGGPTLTRFTMAKHFRGGLEATSEGQMLAASTRVEGSAGYVAIERVTGTLGGRSGSFALQHSGVMNRGTPELKITVVPDSGTDELEGLTGSVTIEIASDGKHSYGFGYTLPEKS